MQETLKPLDLKVPALPAILGYAGLIPFVVLGVGMWFVPSSQQEILNKALLSYAACILAFMGAIHWGLAMTAHANSMQLGLSVLPALLAWLALNSALTWSYSILIIGFVLLCFADSISTRQRNLPNWYPRLRVPLTLIVVVSLISGAFAAISGFA